MSERPDALLPILKARLRARRNELGLTQDEVAERMGMTVRHYQKIEGGELNITLRTLQRAATALRTTAADLLSK